MAYYLQMDGVDDYIITPSLTFTEVLIDFIPHQSSRNQYYMDMRDATFTSPYVLHTSTNDQWAACTVYVDGTQKTSGSIQIPSNTRQILRVVLAGGVAATRTVNFCRRWTGIEFLEADIYSVTFKNGAATIAYYDMSTQTVQDQSGNGNHATLTGGTWVEDNSGDPEPEEVLAAAFTTSLTTMTAIPIVNLITSVTGSATVNSLATLLAEGMLTLTGSASFLANTVFSSNGVSISEGLVSFIGSSRFVADGDTVNNGTDGEAHLQAVAVMVASGQVIISRGATVSSRSTLTANPALILTGSSSFEAITNFSARGVIEGMAKQTGNLKLNKPEDSDDVDEMMFMSDNYDLLDQEFALAGTTAQRPTTRNYVGRRYFDTTLGKPIYFHRLPYTANGEVLYQEVWLDGMGNVV